MQAAKRKETILYYTPVKQDYDRKLKSVFLKLGIRMKQVEEGKEGQMIGYLFGIQGFEEQIDLQEYAKIPEEIMILKDFTGDRITLLLNSLRKAGVPKIALKAIVTPDNAGWSLRELYQELKQEHEALHT